MNESLPSSKSSRHPEEREKIRRIIERRGLCGLANDTKWNELINAAREGAVHVPAYRWKCVDGVPVGWETEWSYHPPFPMISVEWMDLLFRHYPLRPGMSGPTWVAGEVEDHGDRIEALVQRIGFEHVKGKNMLRIFGYSPKDMTLFDD
jgi:hypothetical protein